MERVQLRWPWQRREGLRSGRSRRGGLRPKQLRQLSLIAAPPWTFTVPSDGATLTVTDAFQAGDTFQVMDNGNPIGGTSAVPTSGSCGSDPVPCLADPSVSHGVFNLGPGAHSLTIKMLASPFNTGAAYFRIDNKREHFICYQITEAPFRPRDVVTEDQFGKAKVRVGKPELLCVPATKTEVRGK